MNGCFPLTRHRIPSRVPRSQVIRSASSGSSEECVECYDDGTEVGMSVNDTWKPFSRLGMWVLRCRVVQHASTASRIGAQAAEAVRLASTRLQLSRGIS